MLKLSMKIFRSFYRQKTGSFFLILTGMLISMLGIMFVYSRGKMVYKREIEYNCETTTVKFTADIDTDASLELCSLLLNNEKLPEIYQMTVLDPTTATIGHYCNGALRFTIPYGRYFNSEELTDGRAVLLSDAWLAQADTSFIVDMIDRKIKIGSHNSSYTVIGRYNSTLLTDHFYSREVLIPIYSYIKEGFPFDNVEIIFSKMPAGWQINDLESMIGKYAVDFSLEPPKALEFQALKAFVRETGSHFIILFICCITVLNLLRYWITSNRRKFYIYYICGCSSQRILLLLLVNTCYLYGMAAAFSLLAFMLLEPYFYVHNFISALGLFDYLCICFITLACALVATWIVVVRQLQKFTTVKEIIF